MYSFKICNNKVLFQLKFGVFWSPFYKYNGKITHWNYSAVKGKQHSGKPRLWWDKNQPKFQRYNRRKLYFFLTRVRYGLEDCPGLLFKDCTALYLRINSCFHDKRKSGKKEVWHEAPAIKCFYPEVINIITNFTGLRSSDDHA